MENAHKYTDIIDTQEKYIEDTEVEQEEFYKDTMLTLSLKKNYNIFTHNLITIFQIQQWTQVSRQFILTTQKTSLMIYNIFSKTAADS